MKRLKITPTIIASQGSRNDAHSGGMFPHDARRVMMEETIDFSAPVAGSDMTWGRLLRPFNAIAVTVTAVVEKEEGSTTKKIRPRIFCTRNGHTNPCLN
jgi:hypothetical protein